MVALSVRVSSIGEILASLVLILQTAYSLKNGPHLPYRLYLQEIKPEITEISQVKMALTASFHFRSKFWRFSICWWVKWAVIWENFYLDMLINNLNHLCIHILWSVFNWYSIGNQKGNKVQNGDREPCIHSMADTLA